MVMIMKKIIVFLFIIIVCSIYINEKENILIPDNSIRFRIIANSDKEEDQLLKLTIKNDVEKELFKLLKNTSNIEEAREVISNNIPLIEEIVNKYDIKFDISYGNNYFPEKEYKGIKYKEGNYESLVIKLGESVGKNWWCVLFPPLCLLDEQTNLSDKEYRFFIYDIINNYK